MFKSALLVVLLAAILSVACVEGRVHKKVLLESVTALTFRNGEYTTARRGSPIPQMKCTGGSCNAAKPSSALCKNVGTAGLGDVQWECKAQLPAGVELGSITVSCEGFDNPDDVYVLKGSCGLEYTLEGHPTGNSRTQSNYRSSNQQSYPSSYSYDDGSSGSSSWFEGLFTIAMIVTFYYIFCSNGRRAGPGVNDYGAASGAANNNGGGWFNGGFWQGFALANMFGGGWGNGWGTGWGTGWGGRNHYRTHNSYNTYHNTRGYATNSSPTYGTADTTRRQDSNNHSSTAYGGTSRR